MDPSFLLERVLWLPLFLIWLNKKEKKRKLNLLGRVPEYKDKNHMITYQLVFRSMESIFFYHLLLPAVPIGCLSHLTFSAFSSLTPTNLRYVDEEKTRQKRRPQLEQRASFNPTPHLMRWEDRRRPFFQHEFHVLFPLETPCTASGSWKGHKCSGSLCYHVQTEEAE